MITYIFNYDQNLIVNESLNDWVNFEFYYKGKTKELSTTFFLKIVK